MESSSHRYDSPQSEHPLAMVSVQLKEDLVAISKCLMKIQFASMFLLGSNLCQKTGQLAMAILRGL